MTREEQIRKKANSYTFIAFGELDDFLDVTDGFVAGAKWSDRTMLAKCCEWFENVDFEMTYIDSEGLFDKEQFINDFRKAMEEEL